MMISGSFFPRREIPVPALCKNRELLWLAGEEFPAQRGQGLIHSLQMLHRLAQEGIGHVHRRPHNSPFLNSGASRTRLKNSTYFSNHAVSDSADGTSHSIEKSSSSDSSAISDSASKNS